MAFVFDCLTRMEEPDRFDQSNYRRFDKILRDKLAHNADMLARGKAMDEWKCDEEVPEEYGPSFIPHRATIVTYDLRYVYDPEKGIDTLDELVMEYGMKSKKFQILVRDSFPFVCPECGAYEDVFPT